MVLRDKLLRQVVDKFLSGGRKITIVGAGHVGMALATTLLTQQITNEICIVDKVANKVAGETMDLQHAAILLNHAKISQSKDYECSKSSAVGIITAAAGGTVKLTDMEKLKLNAEIIKDVVPKFLKHSPDAKIIIVTTPVDALTYLAWKVSCLPINQVFGTGTSLNSCRFRVFLADRLGVSPHGVKAIIIGHNGEHMVPCWSSVSVAGTNLRKIYPKFGCKDDPDKWSDIKDKTIKASKDVIAKKGGTWWSMAVCTAHLTGQVLNNSLDISPITTNVKGLHCFEDDLFMSLPCVLGLQGVQQIVNQPLSNTELEELQVSADEILKMQEVVDCSLK